MKIIILILLIIIGFILLSILISYFGKNKGKSIQVLTFHSFMNPSTYNHFDEKTDDKNTILDKINDFLGEDFKDDGGDQDDFDGDDAGGE
ncbi:hypothetical protein ACFSCX_11475 [Bacillus salitolerans]|uniref:Uncharacterized protein n=1 Tax=Bacillus salitolerans TaxID=1437434 RepID=A0ABW4LRT3_9BACI